MERKVIKTKNNKGEDVTVLVCKPTSTQLKDAQLVANKTFQEALKNGALLRAKLDTYMREQGLWSDELEKQVLDFSKKIQDGERRLAKGAAGGFTKAEARKLALDMKKWRNEQTNLILARTELDAYTVEGQAENTRFDYLVSVCVQQENTDPLYSSLEDYKNRASEQYSVDAASSLASMISGFNENWQNDLPENKFLVKYKFTDDKLRLINNDGHLVDEDGRLINEDGRYVNEANEFVDKYGNRIDEKGNPVEEFVEFPE